MRKVWILNAILAIAIIVTTTLLMCITYPNGISFGIIAIFGWISTLIAELYILGNFPK